MLKIALPRRRMLPRFWKFPRIDLPRVRVDFPQEVPPPWKEIEVERVMFAKLKAEWFMVRVILAG